MMDKLRHHIPHPVFAGNRENLPGGSLALDVEGRLLPGDFRFLRHIVHQIVDMEDVSAGEHPGDGSLAAFVHHRPVGDRVQFHPGFLGKLVFGDESHGQQQGIAGDQFFRAGDGPFVRAYGGDGDPFHPFFAVDFHHRVAQLQGDAEILQALDNVPGQAPGIGHQLANSFHLGPFQGHAPGHDKPNVPGA